MSIAVSGAESAVARRLRQAALVASLLVVVFILVWILNAPSAARIIIGALLAAPYVICAPFLYSGYRRTVQWLTLALAPSLVLGLMEAVVTAATRAWSALFVFVLLTTFVVFVAYLRATRPSSPL